MQIPVSIALVLVFFAAAPASGQTPPPERPVLVIPRIDAPPKLEDFLSMAPTPGAIGSLARVEGFVQRWPSDGAAERRRTTVYLGYTTDALHVVYLAFDPDPDALRAHLLRREEVFIVNDDAVELRLDTFGDARESYYLVANPLGVQLDAAWPEVGGEYDDSFDLVWESDGRVTDQGFVVTMKVPFKSLRFNPDNAAWGIYLGRWMPSSGEWTFWPHISNRQRSFLSQMARLQGLDGIAPGRGFQLIPYAASRAFRTTDFRDNLDSRAGLDAKVVFKNSVVVDMALNPDFSQVESDAPQITTNQRFEVFFPEKRPFFLENAGFMQTPINVLFTRRVADPQVGVKMTGRLGPWSAGVFGADDRAPGDRAWSGLARVNRRIVGRSSVGGIVTRRTVAGRDNVVAGLDTKLQIGSVWSMDAQWARSRLERADEPASVGNAAHLSVSRTGRTVESSTVVAHRDAEFTSDLGFIPRVGVRELTHSTTYTFRPASTVSDWGPTLLFERVWSDNGTPLDWKMRPSLAFNLKRASTLGLFAELAQVTLRPGDAGGVTSDLELRADTWGVSASTSPQPSWGISASVSGGRAIHFSPAGGGRPDTGEQWNLRTTLRWRPLTALRVDTTWLRTTMHLDDGRRAFATDIVRTQWAWQFTRSWSLRLIGRLDSTRADSTITAIRARRNVNLDVLLTRLVNPWTALYVGANRNARDRFAQPDSWQVFVKWSHLLRW